MNAVDTSEAVGAKEFNVMMREVVREVKEAEGIEKEGDALTKVLDRIHAKFTPAQLAEMEEGEAVAYMRKVLTEIREEIKSKDAGVSEDANEDAAEGVNEDASEDECEDANEDASEADETTETETTSAVGDESVASTNDASVDSEEGTKRPLTVADLSTLAGSPDLPPAKSIWDEAREERQEEIKKAAAKAATESTGGAGKEETAEEIDAEPLRGVNSTWDALDALTSAVSEKLERESKDGRD